MNGVSRMQTSNKVLHKIDEFKEMIKKTPDIIGVLPCGEMEGHIGIENHFMLEEVYYSFQKEGHFWSQNYSLILSTKGQCFIDKKNKIFLKQRAGKDYFVSQKKDLNTEYLVEKLNENEYIFNLINKIDINKLTIVICNKNYVVNMMPYPGCIIRLLIPPITYSVNIDMKECLILFQILQVINTALSQKDKNI